jgi:hypothetical protein
VTVLPQSEAVKRATRYGQHVAQTCGDVRLAVRVIAPRDDRATGTAALWRVQGAKQGHERNACKAVEYSIFHKVPSSVLMMPYKFFALLLSFGIDPDYGLKVR